MQGFSLVKLRHLVLDEADRLLNMDFEQEIDQILKIVPKERRTQLFSATMTSKVAKLQRACLTDPVKVEVDSKYQTVDTLRQQYLFIPAKYKVNLSRTCHESHDSGNEKVAQHQSEKRITSCLLDFVFAELA